MTDNKENQTDFAAKIAQAKVRSIFSGALVLRVGETIESPPFHVQI